MLKERARKVVRRGEYNNCIQNTIQNAIRVVETVTGAAVPSNLDEGCLTNFGSFVPPIDGAISDNIHPKGAL